MVYLITIKSLTWPPWLLSVGHPLRMSHQHTHTHTHTHTHYTSTGPLSLVTWSVYYRWPFDLPRAPWLLRDLYVRVHSRPSSRACDAAHCCSLAAIWDSCKWEVHIVPGQDVKSPPNTPTPLIDTELPCVCTIQHLEEITRILLISG